MAHAHNTDWGASAVLVALECFARVTLIRSEQSEVFRVQASQLNTRTRKSVPSAGSVLRPGEMPHVKANYQGEEKEDLPCRLLTESFSSHPTSLLMVLGGLTYLLLMVMDALW